MKVSGEEAIRLDFCRYVSSSTAELGYGQQIIAMTYSEMAHASPKPSLVEVPRPNSSIMTSECSVAD
jgi:hypothetical protein